MTSKGTSPGKWPHQRYVKWYLDPWVAFKRSALICLVFGLVFLGIAVRKVSRLPLDGAALQFDAKRAHGVMTTLSKRFPNRLPWHENRMKAGDWLLHELRSMGYQPREMRFSENIAGTQYTDLRNIYAERRGTKRPEEIILVVAHYDTTDTTVEGAMDDASGVGIVLELARVFSKEDPERTMIFLLTDSEEFGAYWGAKVFSEAFDRARNIIAAMNFDFLAPEKQVAILTLCDGLGQGFTPLWLRELALDSLRSIGGFEVRDLMGMVEYVQRAILIPAADHGVFLSNGIPAFNWVGQIKDFARQMAFYHHTPHDVAEAMEVDSFDSFGRSAERLARSLNSLSSLPKDFRNYSYLKLSDRFYIDGWAVTVLQILVFLPFLILGIHKFGAAMHRHPKRLVAKVMKNEAKNMAIVLGSMMIGYLVMRFLPELKVITQYEASPATQKSLLLYSPNLLAILLVICCGMLFYWILSKTFGEQADSEEYGEIRHAFEAALFVFVIILAFVGNGYLATLLLVPPAYLWTFLRIPKSAPDRIINTMLLLGGLVTFVVISTILGSIFHVGIVYWYLFLSAIYGLVSVYTIVLFMMSITILIRLFRSFVFIKRVP